MNISQMRKVDSFAGAIICLLLEVYERLKRLLYRNQPHKKEIKKVLITKYLGMGSILLATPMLNRLKKEFPESKITFLTFQSNSSFAELIPLIDDVLFIRTNSLFYFLMDFFKILLKIRHEKFDIIFDLEFFARFSTIVSYLSGSMIRVGYYLPKLWRGDLLTHQIHFNPHKHVTEVIAAQLEPLGLNVEDFSLIPPLVRAEKKEAVKKILNERGIEKNESLISVNVNASDLSVERRWPRESFVQLISFIIENHGNAKVVMVGSKSETAYVRETYNQLPENVKENVIDLSGLLDIESFIALLNGSDLFISNDSGPLHIAASLDRPTISFFGPETPSLYGPIGKDNKVFYSDLYCSPCLNVYNAKTAMCKGNNVCMQDIKPNDVINYLSEKGLLN